MNFQAFMLQLMQTLGFRNLMLIIAIISALPLVWLSLSMPGKIIGKLLIAVPCALGISMLAGGPMRDVGLDLPHPLACALLLLTSIALFLLIIQLVRTLLLVPAGLLCFAWKAPWHVLVSRALSLGIVVIGVGLGTLSFWNTIRTPDVREVTVAVKDLPEALEGFHIVQITDLHLGVIFDADWLRRVVDKANALQPDMIALTGDTGEAAPERIAADLKPLEDLRATYGVFCSLGNHESFQGLANWLNFYPSIGTLLRNASTLITHNGATLAVAGIDDSRPDPALAMDSVPSGTPAVMLGHRPDRAPAVAEAGASLYLAGHTHGGAMPGIRNLAARANGGMVAGVYPVGSMTAYVSAGTGLWSYMPLRIDNPSEITSIRLVRAR